MKKTILFSAILLTFIVDFTTITVCWAQPYGKGLYNENVPYGNQTALSITTSGDINIPITPTTSGVQSTGFSSIVVSSTDVKGYKLYIRALDSTNMDNLGATLPTSSNATPAALAINTWGYNTDASNNFVGISTSDTLIRSITTPISNSITNVTYGIKIDLAKPAGNYTSTVVYTAVPQTD